MCGRFALGLPRRDIVQAIRDAHPDLDLGEWVDEEEFHPRYNIAPRSQSPVIRRRNRFDDREASENQESAGGNKRAIMQTMKWGLIPHWSKHEDKNLNTINARAEHLVDKGGMWAGIKGRKRCAVICQGYYEWQKKGKERLPHFTKYKDGQLMLLAGMYDSVTLEGETKPLWTFTIVTTDAPKQLSWLHDRMPVILSTKAELDKWLDCSSQTWSPELSKIFIPYHNRSRPLDCYAVPKDVGKVSAESSTFIEPIAQRKDGIQAMFAKQSGGKKAKASSASPSPDEKSETKKPASSGKAKRKRELPELDQESGIEILDGPSEEKKPRKSEAIEEDVEPKPKPSGTREQEKAAQASPSPAKPKGHVSKTPQKSPAKKKADLASPSDSKITSFFAKGK